ncbi:spore germination protein [Gorillibacterium sp. CAU 1737]|uniref:spore germination protein n=1 Tax=Gorillibacterium sp. CAU 1737 TaxID=3140362 RepID=UPI0032603AD3
MSKSLLQGLTKHLTNCSDVTFKPVRTYGRTGVLVYIPSIINTNALQHSILLPLREKENAEEEWTEFVRRMEEEVAFSIPGSLVEDPSQAADHVVMGKAVLYLEGFRAFASLDITQYQKRSISESQNELVIIGPQEAFIEDMESNLSLIRHKIKHPGLKTQMMTVGTFTKTNICLLYIEGLASESLIQRLRENLSSIQVDGVFGISYLMENMKMSRSLLPLFLTTERPDAAASSVLDGRVGILVDGTPTVILAPVTFFSFMQSSEDYYQNYFAASWIRLVRLFFSLVSVLLPSLYVAITTFHPQIIPSNLLITIASARENVPFSALSEALVMELTFEALREAGTRIPKPLGQTVSIIGGIVIGQAAVQAGIVSAPLVIVVSVTGIASYIIPHMELGLIFRLLRFPILLLGGTMGLIGVFAGSFLLYAHMASLRSFQTPYLEPLAPLIFREWKDTFFRFPSSSLNKRKRTPISSREPSRGGASGS